jgi:phage FluMu protein Com
MMRELNVNLDFACCNCGSSMSVTLKCAGKGLSGGDHTVAAVKVPCPTCSNINQLYFEPNGTIHAVAPCQGPRQIPEPSVN